jgi:hypothetical protein
MDSLHSEISCLGGDKDAIRGVASIPWVSETKGGVAPIGWLNSPAITLIDLALNDYPVIWAAAGHPHTVFPTTFAELSIASGAIPMIVGD